MCIIYLAYESHPEYPLILIANRDEFYARPTSRATYWDDHPEIYGGRDLVGGGTWLGITTTGRIAAVTNYREPGVSKGELSRGALVGDFLKGEESAADYLSNIETTKSRYSGFNLLVGEFNSSQRDIFYFSNRDDGMRRLTPGVYGLSNHLLDTPWPKLRDGRARFHKLIDSPVLQTEQMFDLLADEALADDVELPNTGLEYGMEKALSAIFIRTPIYGTRCSSVVTFDKDFKGTLVERVFV